MCRERAREVRRARLFLALEEELEVRGQRDLRGIERVEGREHRDDRALVVARRARINARLAGERKFRLRPGNHRRAVLYASRAQGWLERRRFPRVFRPDRLAVEMRIEKERALRALHAAFAVDGNRCVRGFQDRRGNAALFQHAHQQVCVRADVGGIRRDVRQRQQLAQFRRRWRPHAWRRAPPRRPWPARVSRSTPDCQQQADNRPRRLATDAHQMPRTSRCPTMIGRPPRLRNCASMPTSRNDEGDRRSVRWNMRIFRPE